MIPLGILGAARTPIGSGDAGAPTLTYATALADGSMAPGSRTVTVDTSAIAGQHALFAIRARANGGTVDIPTMDINGSSVPIAVATHSEWLWAVVASAAPVGASTTLTYNPSSYLRSVPLHLAFGVGLNPVAVSAGGQATTSPVAMPVAAGAAGLLLIALGADWGSTPTPSGSTALLASGLNTWAWAALADEDTTAASFDPYGGPFAALFNITA